ncbi:MAG: hypothetical protein QXV73_04105 [Candidatus Micrarchaeia archaeon]
MTGSDYISLAKTYYSVEMFTPAEALASYLNLARDRVNRLTNANYGEYSIQVLKDYPSYTLQKPFERLFRVAIKENNLMQELFHIATGDFVFKDAMKGTPCYYNFIPPKVITFYPTPNKDTSAYLYGTLKLEFRYNSGNLSANDSEIPDTYADAVAIDLAKRIALLDQQYELVGLLENLFFTKLQESKM